MRAILKLLMIIACSAPWISAPAMVDAAGADVSARDGLGAATLRTAQRNGLSLSEAVESVRRRADVDRVISAETRVRNGREVHHIRVMTRDGKVKTYEINGRRRN